jgi:hypothetical protein
MLFISSSEVRMAFHVFLFLLVCFLMLCLAWLCRPSLLHRGLAHWRAGAVHPVVRRLLKPRTPRDCPACCVSSTFSAGAEPSPLPVRPWCEVKSRRGAPKRIDTQGFACPNLQCQYLGNTDARVHALVSSETPFPAGRSCALCAGRRTGCFRS